ncbi:hypothetical protein [Prosthecochloris sp. HL-130-GSB]|jgi:hypothetical protein|uniref:hypothetical protein n=1 Tax=Prosthecochloris sp. HL-130-GSB TaxID=1974213 RepID=UPI000A1C02B4|nr:hypothetical protein [Prosthecochloris sp. HL-130-GSB]ARM30238.1 hypothetical protein B9H02_01495 [Prosthecochloris sp. HL-130-GSB]MBO8091847.1 hypothetical protein [Prosthecochloris sp.]
MDIRHIVLDDNNPLHRELAIFREGELNHVRITDKTYTAYHTLNISAHDHTCLFHFNIIEALNMLPFVSETGNGLDSWDEAYLHHSRVQELIDIIVREKKRIMPGRHEKVLLGWHKEPQPVAYWREIDTTRFCAFLDNLLHCAADALEDGFDLEFIL